MISHFYFYRKKHVKEKKQSRRRISHWSLSWHSQPFLSSLTVYTSKVKPFLNNTKVLHYLPFSLSWQLLWCSGHGGLDWWCLSVIQGGGRANCPCASCTSSHFQLKKCQFHLSVPDEAVKIILLNCDPLVHVFLILCVTKWDVHINHFHWISNHAIALKCQLY